MMKNKGKISSQDRKNNNFGPVMKRLFKELGSYRKVIYVTFILAIVSSILAIYAPNKLRDLVDNISKGIKPDTEALEEISGKIGDNLKKQIFEDIEYRGVKISVSDQMSFAKVLQEGKTSINQGSGASGKEISQEDREELMKKFEELPESVKSIISPKMDMDAISDIGLILACLYLLSTLFSYMQAYMIAGATNNFAKELRSRISRKINALPLKYFDKNQIGDVLSRVTNDVDSISTNMNQSFSTVVSSVTMILGALLMMFITNYKMALVAVLSSLLGFVFMFLILSKSQKYFVERQKIIGKLNGQVEEVYSGLNVVKIYNGKKESTERFDNLNESVYKANMMSQFLSGLMQPIMMFIGNFGYVVVSIFGAVLAKNGEISFGVIVAFMSYIRLFTNPLAQMAQAMTALQASAAASDRVFEFLDEEEMASQEGIKDFLDKDLVKGNIEFKNVVFTYDGNEKPTIKNFSADIKPGQKVAIVGPTGAGKTTMVNLLMKFYDISEGDILIDGISINKLTRENIHDLFTMVLQDTWLFEGSISENIKYNMDRIGDAEIKEVSRFIGLSHFIKTLPEAYETVISDSESVSAGQRQLLTIARGMLKDAPFLILDEATSNVDTRTEILVQEAMDKLMYGKTAFVIAHRLSTIKNSDLILVMKDGNIIEQGNHDQLMKKGGFYSDLYNSQFEL